MKSLLRTIRFAFTVAVLAGVVGGEMAAAQQGAGGRAGSSAGSPAVAAQISPVVHGDRSVTFYLHAPKASTVTLTGDFSTVQNDTQPLRRGTNGEWSLTVPPLPPGLYSYFYTVDGVEMADPADPDPKIGRQPQSAFAVPGASADWMLPKLGVPHGIVQVVEYDAHSIHRVERMHVYLPPGYRADDTKRRYPVVYLLMGGGDFDDVWISSGHANDIMDNLLAAHNVVPAILVMPEVFVAAPHTPDYARNSQLFGTELTRDIIPYVDAHYNTVASPEMRALGGLSVPNVLTDVLFAHYGTFDWVMLTGNGLTAEKVAAYEREYPGLLTNPANVHRVHYFIGDGVNAMTYKGSSNLAGELKAMGYAVTYRESRGIHGWPWFRLEFYQGMQTLFR